MARSGLFRWDLHERLVSVAVEPQLASWDASTQPSQIRLRAYLDEVEAALAPWMDDSRDLALHVDVRLPDGVDLLRHRDLENYLTPLAQRLRWPNIVRASATKAYARDCDLSRVELWTVDQRLVTGSGWHLVDPTGSSATTAWKSSIRDALLRADVPEILPGPVDTEILFICSTRRRNWVNLWKPAGDALGPLLGEPDPRKAFNPADDRITDLALHLACDESVASQVRLAIRATRGHAADAP